MLTAWIWSKKNEQGLLLCWWRVFFEVWGFSRIHGIMGYSQSADFWTKITGDKDYGWPIVWTLYNALDTFEFLPLVFWCLFECLLQACSCQTSPTLGSCGNQCDAGVADRIEGLTVHLAWMLFFFDRQLQSMTGGLRGEAAGSFFEINHPLIKTAKIGQFFSMIQVNVFICAPNLHDCQG